MDYKHLVADIIVYSMKRIELAEFDLNVTREEVYEGEIKALRGLLLHINGLLCNNSSDELIECHKLIREVLGELDERKGDKHLD